MTTAQLIGGIVAVISARMPAMLALLKIKELHILINSRLSQLIESTAKASHSDGQLEGRKEGRQLADAEAANLLKEAGSQAKAVLDAAATQARFIVAEAAENARRSLAGAASEALEKYKTPTVEKRQ